jgi:uncharacterized protein YjiS (DUF1127 family)
MPVMQVIPRSQEHLAIGGQRDITGLAAWWSLAWRAFGIWRERKRARAALAKMTERELADIGMTASDRAMALEGHQWADPDSNRNIMILSQFGEGSCDARNVPGARVHPNQSKRKPA